MCVQVAGLTPYREQIRDGDTAAALRRRLGGSRCTEPIIFGCDRTIRHACKKSKRNVDTRSSRGQSFKARAAVGERNEVARDGEASARSDPCTGRRSSKTAPTSFRERADQIETRLMSSVITEQGVTR